MSFDRQLEYRVKYEERHFLSRKYYVASVGIVNRQILQKYIRDKKKMINSRTEESSGKWNGNCNLQNSTSGGTSILSRRT